MIFEDRNPEQEQQDRIEQLLIENNELLKLSLPKRHSKSYEDRLRSTRELQSKEELLIATEYLKRSSSNLEEIELISKS